MSVGSVKVARPVNQREGGGASPTPALQDLFVKPVPNNIARSIVERHHYLHSFPGATKLAFGVFVGFGLQGAVVLGCGPVNAYSLVSGANPDDCLALTRLWLSDDPPGNSESKVIGSVIRGFEAAYPYEVPSHLCRPNPRPCGDDLPSHELVLHRVVGSHSPVRNRRW